MRYCHNDSPGSFQLTSLNYSEWPEGEPTKELVPHHKVDPVRHPEADVSGRVGGMTAQVHHVRQRQHLRRQRRWVDREHVLR